MSQCEDVRLLKNLTSAFVVDAALISRASGVVSATNNANAIETDVSAVAESVAVADWAADSVDAPRIRQASLIAVFKID